MPLFRRKPEIIEAVRWFRNGDHPRDESEILTPEGGGEPFLSEGKIVRRYRNPDVAGDELCEHELCAAPMREHGFIDGDAGGAVCPGDWIITTEMGGYMAVKAAWFERVYEPVERAGGPR